MAFTYIAFLFNLNKGQCSSSVRNCNLKKITLLRKVIFSYFKNAGFGKDKNFFYDAFEDYIDQNGKKCITSLSFIDQNHILITSKITMLLNEYNYQHP